MTGTAEYGFHNAEIVSMVSDSPMGPFEFKEVILENPGKYCGLYGNNHHCVFTFNNRWYITYHTRLLEKNMGIDKYEGYHAYSWHIGYSLPVCDWFKVTPFVGKAVWAQGYWDGGDWVVTDSGIANNFIPDGWYHKGLDVGIELNFTIATYLNIFINATTYNIGFGLGGSIPFRMFD